MRYNFVGDDVHHIRMDNLGSAYEWLVDWMRQKPALVVAYAVNSWFFRRIRSLWGIHSRWMRNQHVVHMPLRLHVMHKMVEDVDQHWWSLDVMSSLDGKILAEWVDAFFHKSHEYKAVVALPRLYNSNDTNSLS